METGTSVSRRQLALALVVLLAVGAAAAAGYVLYVDDESADVGPQESVPEDVDYVGYLEPDTMHEDEERAESTRRGLRFQSAVQFYDGPDFPASFAVQAEGDLDPEAVAWVTYFGRSNGSDYDARVVQSNWSTDDLLTAVEDRHDVELEEGEYRGLTLYTGDGRAVAVLSGDTHVVGNETAVRDAVDVAVGETEPFDGELREQFEATDDGYVRFAYRFRPSNVPDYPFVGEDVRNLQYVSGAYSLNGSDMGVRTTLTAEDDQSARSIRSILNAGITFYRVETENATLSEELDRIELEQSDRRLVISYESSPERFRVLVRGLVRNEPETEGAGNETQGSLAGRTWQEPR